MNTTNYFFRTGGAALVWAALAITQAGCAGYVETSGGGVATVSPIIAPQDDYLYYPGYEVYYSGARHQYAYRENGAWVSRSAPRGVSMNDLRASPSVRMDFHDSPANHHETVARQYPKTWRPAPAHQTGADREEHNGR